MQYQTVTPKQHNEIQGLVGQFVERFGHPPSMSSRQELPRAEFLKAMRESLESGEESAKLKGENSDLVMER